MWKVGAQDRLSYDLSKLKRNYLVPFWMWLLSNSVNILFALLISLSMWFESSALSTIGGIVAPITHIIEGMYTGLLAINVGGAPLNSYWFMHFMTPIPALAICYLGYFLGSKNFKILGGKAK